MIFYTNGIDYRQRQIDGMDWGDDWIETRHRLHGASITQSIPDQHKLLVWVYGHGPTRDLDDMLVALRSVRDAP